MPFIQRFCFGHNDAEVLLYLYVHESHICYYITQGLMQRGGRGGGGGGDGEKNFPSL